MVIKYDNNSKVSKLVDISLILAILLFFLFSLWCQKFASAVKGKTLNQNMVRSKYLNFFFFFFVLNVYTFCW